MKVEDFPGDDCQDKRQAFGDRSISLAEAVLRRVRDQHDNKEIHGPELPGLPPRHNPENSNNPRYMMLPRKTISAIPMLGSSTETQSMDMATSLLLRPTS